MLNPKKSMRIDNSSKPVVAHRNPCHKTLGLGQDGQLIKVPKKKFANLDQAVEVAKHMNAVGATTYKLVAYKCSECHLWHIGRNETLLTPKLIRQLRTLGYGTTTKTTHLRRTADVSTQTKGVDAS